MGAIALLEKLGIEGAQTDGRDWRGDLGSDERRGGIAGVGCVREDWGGSVGVEGAASIAGRAELWRWKGGQLADELVFLQFVGGTTALEVFGVLLETFETCARRQPTKVGIEGVERALIAQECTHRSTPPRHCAAWR